MARPAPLPIVAVSLQPLLLADCLRTLLVGHDVRVVLPGEGPSSRYAVAIRSADGPRVDADLHIVLDPTPRPRGVASTEDGEVIARFDDLEGALDFVRERTGGSRQ